jgi:ArsR family transcriptional regulator, lead/cadmium/zinc/bismuth-responsive transcriptional repressor
MSGSAHAHPVDPDRVDHARARLPSPDEAAQLTSVLSLMADPTRARVLLALDLVEELCVGDLALALEANEDAVGYAQAQLRFPAYRGDVSCAVPRPAGSGARCR